ncbi:tetratricopeptide repeat protein [Streptomyces sp. HK10]|uniref:tetratricopeptide repeat protein n=1 Tax=Streptomyces sp. HK10 TaxID=3373255 RepID=UPI00374782B9
MPEPSRETRTASNDGPFTEAEESVTLPTDEQGVRSDESDGTVAAFLSLALVGAGREREAAALALTAEEDSA